MAVVYRIREYDFFVEGGTVAGHTGLPKPVFCALENFILSSVDSKEDVSRFMEVGFRKGIGKVILAKNYVGVIKIGDGVVIEILPKIYSLASGEEDEDFAVSRRLLIDMLKTLKNPLYRSIQSADADLSRMDLFEVFIRMFIDEVFSIVKKGLKSGYERRQENEVILKGKLKFSEQVRYNLIHRERSYIEYDEFSVNRVENRLLKTVLIYLYRLTTTSRNKRDLRTLSAYFSEIGTSDDYERDFKNLVTGRETKHYFRALMWGRIFLKKRNFLPLAGVQVVFSLLFPMEVLFESYVAAKMRKIFTPSYKILTQDERYYLFDEPQKFSLRPDIVIEHRETKRVFVLDTKWKVLMLSKPNYAISQADMYQMYVYHKKYRAQQAILLYPMSKLLETDSLEFVSKDGVVVRVYCLDLCRIEESLRRLEERIEKDIGS